MWTALPGLEFARRALRWPRISVRELAIRVWQIAPGVVSVAAPAYFLPGQLDRVTAWEFAAENPRRQMAGGRVVHAPTTGYLIRDVILGDGRLFKGNACDHLHPKTSSDPVFRIEHEIAQGAIYCTAGGIKYFGQWLMDDCNTYQLARNDGVPISTAHPLWPHTPGYESWLDMHPVRQRLARIHEAIVYDDVGQNDSKHNRALRLRSKLLAHVAAPRPHPGVFILRGTSGRRRLLLNEPEIAEALARSRGLRIIDPTRMSVPEIVTACAGAAAVVGVEGSGLMHAIALLPRGGKVLTIQPPNRFVGLYKNITDRDDQHFGFVVGISSGADFTADAEEIERTLDLFPADATA